MAHRNARLTPAGRELLVRRVLADGWPVPVAAASVGVARATAYKWLHRYRTEGRVGLTDRSSRPHTSPRALPAAVTAMVLTERWQRREGPHRLAARLGLARSTVYRILRQHGESRLRDRDRCTRQVVRYERDHPGELVHVDVKKLGRIPDGGGHRVHGRTGASRGRGLGYDYLHVAIDDYSRLAFVQVYADERAATCAAFLTEAVAFFAAHGVTVARVLTDNARAYTTGRTFQAALLGFGIQHRRTRPYRPQTNGKAERFNRTLIDEWAYHQLYPTNADRLATLPDWLHLYNYHRPHTALGGRPPAARVNNLCGNHT
jgi:transposase InsO family protein